MSRLPNTGEERGKDGMGGGFGANFNEGSMSVGFFHYSIYRCWQAGEVFRALEQQLTDGLLLFAPGRRNIFILSYW